MPSSSRRPFFIEEEPSDDEIFATPPDSVIDLPAPLKTSTTRPPPLERSRFRDSFAAPEVLQSRPTSTMMRRMSLKPSERLRSSMLLPGVELSKPWLDPLHIKGSRDTRDARLAYFLTFSLIVLGIATSVLRCYFSWQSILVLNEGEGLCLVMDEQFESNKSVFGPTGKWMREVEVGGFGNGQFEMTTSSFNNSFVQNGQLHITPTLTSDHLGFDTSNAIFNATDCTWNQTATPGWKPEEQMRNCDVVSNSTTGVIINPVQSARLSTRRSVSIRYGKVQVRAKMPTGDWLWPAIWMLPTQDIYGPWPGSGEIDLAEARGNGPRYPAQGNNYVRGALNWGPLPFLNSKLLPMPHPTSTHIRIAGVTKTYGAWGLRRSSFAKSFHTYTLEWTDQFIRISVDTRLHYLVNMRFSPKTTFWDRGDFPAVVKNGTDYIELENPWANGTPSSAPFDQDFFLILNVAVGGTNGWFRDNVGDKPWVDQSSTAMREFAKAQNKWYPTWPTNVEDRSMVVDSVKIWQKC